MYTKMNLKFRNPKYVVARAYQRTLDFSLSPLSVSVVKLIDVQWIALYYSKIKTDIALPAFVLLPFVYSFPVSQ